MLANAPIGGNLESQRVRARSIRGVALRAGLIVSVAVAIVVSVIAIETARFGSLAAAIEYWQGERLIAAQRTVSIGSVSPDSVVPVSYSLLNLTGQPVKIVGADESCDCIVMDDVPFAIAHQETRTIKASIHVPKTPGPAQ